MKISDLLIIYFSVGAPFGVYVYFQNRAFASQEKLWLKSFSAFLFWIPAALRLISDYKSGARGNFYLGRDEKILTPLKQPKNLYSIQKQLEQIMLRSDPAISIFEFRETLERYAGLTLAAQNEISEATGKEFFLAAENKNVEIAAKCFGRRNRERLFFHQTSARQDFLQTIENLLAAVTDKKEFGILTYYFVKILKDSEARNLLENIFIENLPIDKPFPAEHLEKDLWKPQMREPPNANSISTVVLQTMSATATTNLSKKD